MPAGLIFVIIATLCSPYSVKSDEQIVKELVVKNAVRSVDVASQLVKASVKITLENTGTTPVSKFLFSIEPNLQNRLSFIGASSVDGGKSPLSVVKTTASGRKGDIFWKIDLKGAIGSGKTANVEIDYVLTEALSPYPTRITQKEKQLVKYEGSVYLYSPYTVQEQTTLVVLGTKTVESYTKFKPTSLNNDVVSYGPYARISPYTVETLSVHYENNSPFLKATRIERTVEVSHWGNIAIEETVDLLHTGALLKGPFSRYDFQREMSSGLSAVKSFKTVLPASASDAYYRDDIGNISTSHLRVMGDSVELDLRPRFPLFGGWKTHYVLGYNVPSYEYLYYSGDRYKLKIRVLDHVFDDMVVDELITKIVLPEGSENIHLVTPYSMTRLPDTRHTTYLDTKGRTVVTVTKRNLVENHIQSLELDYDFPRILMLQEPLLVVLALYILFITVIIYVRLDFSISKDEVGESRLRVSGLVDKILLLLDKRASIYASFDDQLVKIKTNKDVNAFTSAVKNVNVDYKNLTSTISDLCLKLKPDSPDIVDKLGEVQKLDRALKEIYNQKQALYSEKLATGKISRGAFVDADAALNKKKEETVDKINSVVKNLH